MLAVEMPPLLQGREFFISKEYSLLRLGTIHVLLTTTRLSLLKAWKVQLQVGEWCMYVVATQK